MHGIERFCFHCFHDWMGRARFVFAAMLLGLAGPTGAAEKPADALLDGFADIPHVRAAALQQRGAIQAAWTADGRDLDTPTNLKSASKSVLGALVGIAIARGDLSGVDAAVVDSLPDYANGLDDPHKRAITFEDLLTLRSGLRSTSFANYGAWVSGDDWVRGKLAQPLEAEPGTRMRYSTGDTHLLAAALTHAVGEDLQRYADRHLFEPLGGRIADWDRAPEGVRFGGNNLALTPRDFLAFGQLYLDRGVHDGESIVPADWVQRSLSVHIPDTGFVLDDHDYGYLWWHTRLGGDSVWFAWGHGGQYLFLLPEHDAVVLVLRDPSTRDTAGNRAIYRVLEERVVPALEAARN